METHLYATCASDLLDYVAACLILRCCVSQTNRSRNTSVSYRAAAYVPARCQGRALMLRKTAPGAALQQWASLVDCAVYTRNRHFRMLGCCKAGKAAVLAPTRRYSCTPGKPRRAGKSEGCRQGISSVNSTDFQIAHAGAEPIRAGI